MQLQNFENNSRGNEEGSQLGDNRKTYTALRSCGKMRNKKSDLAQNCKTLQPIVRLVDCASKDHVVNYYTLFKLDEEIPPRNAYLQNSQMFTSGYNS